MLSLNRALAARLDRINKDEKGFTLIELLVVVIIIGILAAIAIPIFLGQQEQAKGSAVESAITTAKIEVVSSIVDTGAFPTAAAIAIIEAESDGGDANITIAITGSASAFCIAGTHSEVAGGAWAADDSSGVIDGTCSAAFVATP